jgi:hypothetical protein
LLEPVVARYPEFTPAWALLAYVYVLTPSNTPGRYTVSIDEYRQMLDSFLVRAEAAAERAIQLAPDQADGYVSLSTVQQFRGKWILAEELISKALAIDPNNPDGLYEQGFVLQGAGRVKEELVTRQKLYALEPLVPRFNQLLANALWLNGQDDAAVGLANRSGGANRPLRLAMIHAAAGRFSEAAEALSMVPPEMHPPGAVEAAARIMRTAPASAASQQPIPNLGLLSFVYAYVGAPDKILEPFVGEIPTFVWHPSYASVRKTESFKMLMRSMGVVDYWRAKGWPDLCRPAGADDFVCD